MSDYFRFERNEMHQFLPKVYKTVLEIGCGNGNFLDSLEVQAEKWGVELDSDSAKIAARKGINVVAGDFNQVMSQIPDAYFELIICNDVIEHIADTDECLTVIKQKLAKSGSVVGSIPNVRYVENLYEMLIKKDWKYVDAGILDRTHLRFFTHKSLVTMFNENAFSIESLKGINSIFKPMRSVRRYIIAAFALIIATVTLGWYRDCFYLQYGFRLMDLKQLDNDIDQ